MKLFSKMIMGVLLLAGLSGCSTMKPVPVSLDFWEQKDKKIAVVLHEIPEHGVFMKVGNQGLLDAAINGAMTSGVAGHIETLKADTFVEVKDIFIKELQKEGFAVVDYPKTIVLKDLEKIQVESNCYNRDLSVIFDETDCDNIVILHLVNFGAIRSYRGFFPTSAPEGSSNVRGLMVSKVGNQILWYTGHTEAYVKEPAMGEWDQEPDYPNLTNAVYKALERSKTSLKENFFD